MSTAGKVLVILIILVSVGWMVLTAGVSELNRNGNKLVASLEKDIARLTEEVKATRAEITKLKDNTTIVQEETDRRKAVLRSRQADVEEASSQILDSVAKMQYELETSEKTVQTAQQDDAQRLADLEAEKKELADREAEVKVLKAEYSSLLNRLAALRDEFKSRYKDSVGRMGGSVQ